MSQGAAWAEGFNEGLEAAAKRLEATAKDYDQMVGNEEQASALIPMHFASRDRRIVLFKEKATLLRGQARIVRELKR